MKLYLPEIYPDELIYSWFSRSFVYSGCLNHKMAISQLLYSVKCNPSVEFMGHLNKYAESEIAKIYSIDDLILNHSMFPQYARFLSQEKRESALTGLKNYCDPRKVLTILPRNEKEKYLKYCPICAKEDRDIYGETYWHRKHQIRNVSICPIHQCKLKDSDVLVTAEKTFTWVPAELAAKETEPVVSDNEELIAYVRYLTKIFDAVFSGNSNTPVSATLYAAMDAAKYKKGKHRNTAQFSEDLQEFYKKMGLDSIASIYQIQRVFVSGSNEFSVICQIAYLLNVVPEDLLNPKITEEAINLEAESHYNRNRSSINWEQFDKDNAPFLETFCKNIYDGSATETGRPERVSAREVYKLLGVTSYGFANLPECQKILKKYEESYEESSARKVVWAYRKIKAQHKGKVHFFDIRKLTGIKKERFPSIELIEKYSNKATAEEILRLL